MFGTITARTLRDGMRGLLWWGLGLASLSVMTVLFYPFLKEVPGLEELLKGLPDAILRLIGDSEMLSGIGYLNANLYGAVVPILFLFYGVFAGAGAIAGEEENRTLDMLLSNPVARSRVVVEKALAMVSGLAVLGLVLWAATYLASLPTNMDIDVWHLAAINLSAALFGFFMGGLGLAIGASTGARTLAIGLGAFIGIFGYLWNSLAPLVERLEPFRKLSPFYYYFGANPLRNGLDPVHAAVLGVGGLLFVVIAVFGFRRRDVGV